MKLLQGAVLLAGLALSPVAGLAQTPTTYTENGRALFSFAVPDFWVLRNGGPREITDTELGDARAVSRVMGLRPEASDGVWMGFVSPAGVSSIEDGLDYLGDIDRFLVREPQVTDRSAARIGGRPAQVVRGTGTRDGRGINFTAAVIDLPGPRVAVAVTILAGDADPGFVADLNGVFASFRAAN
ncbi:MAG: hypothetical protein OIF47_00060 [Marinibacterium sp.]|nr:hypothetical protein [Marinibacterium sp.]